MAKVKTKRVEKPAKAEKPMKPTKPAKAAKPTKAKKKGEKTAAEKPKPGELTEVPSLAKINVLVEAARLVNSMESRLANLAAEVKHIAELLPDAKGREYDKLAGKKERSIEDSKLCKATKKAAGERLLAATLALVGEGAYKPAQDDKADLFHREADAEEDIPGQLTIQTADLTTKATPLIDGNLRHLDPCEVVDGEGNVIATGKFDQFYTKNNEASVFVGSDTKTFRLERDKLTLRRVPGSDLVLGKRYVFTPKDPAAKLKECVGAVVRITPTGHVIIQPDSGEGGVHQISRGVHDYTWAEAKDAA